MTRKIVKRSWRITQTGHALRLRARLASTADEIAAATTALTAYLADIEHYEHEGSEVAVPDVIGVGETGLQLGDLQARAGRADAAKLAWQSAAERLRPVAEQLNPAAMTCLAAVDLRLGNLQDAHLWADKVRGTTYRHPAFADLQQQLGQAQQSGQTPRP